MKVQIQTEMRTISKIFGVCMAFLCAILTACSNGDVVFQQAVELPEYGWCKDSIVMFDYQATDTSGLYDIVVDIRNDGNYGNQNFWLFITSLSPDSLIYKDTLECVLADNYGRWIGEGSGSLRHLPVAFLSQVKFPVKGKYHFEFIQGMRYDTLIGIHDIGMRVMKSSPEADR